MRAEAAAPGSTDLSAAPVQPATQAATQAGALAQSLAWPLTLS